MNSPCLPTKCWGECRRKQRGAVLFFVLIALVALMLAGAALVRSVDTATIISGNLAFRQAATSSGDRGIEQAMTWLKNHGASTDNNDTSKGYYSNVGSFTVTDESVWADGKSVVAKVGSDTADASGSEVRYVIERMCSEGERAATEENCLFSDDPPKDGSQGIDPPRPDIDFKSPIYRITARAKGPRNTVSYIQGFVY